MLGRVGTASSPWRTDGRWCAAIVRHVLVDDFESAQMLRAQHHADDLLTSMTALAGELAHQLADVQGRAPTEALDELIRLFIEHPEDFR